MYQKFWQSRKGKFFTFYVVFGVFLIIVFELPVLTYSPYYYIVISLILFYPAFLGARAEAETSPKKIPFLVRELVLFALLWICLGWPTLRISALSTMFFDGELNSIQLKLLRYSNTIGPKETLCRNRIRLVSIDDTYLVCSDDIKFTGFTKLELWQVHRIEGGVAVSVKIKKVLGINMVLEVDRI